MGGFWLLCKNGSWLREAFRQATWSNQKTLWRGHFWGSRSAFELRTCQRICQPVSPKGYSATPHLAEDAGLAELQKAIALDPQLTAGTYFFSLYWERHQRFDLALTAIEKAIHLSPTTLRFTAKKGAFKPCWVIYRGLLLLISKALRCRITIHKP
jgi:hypothetical protein